MIYGSVCSGIESATVAWRPLGWRAAWFSEIDPFACRLLAHHYPETPNLGDMREIEARIRSGEVQAPDVLVGGTPCQSFSFAGLRKGLDDARGNLTLAFARLADAVDVQRLARSEAPAWVLWENVPGVLSDKTNAFGCLLSALAGGSEPMLPPSRRGKRAGSWPAAGVVQGPARVVAWRVLDAQFHGVAQRRRRVFVLARGGAGAWACADALLPLGESVSRDPPARRAPGKEVAGSLAARARGGGGLGIDFDLAGGLQASGGGVDENDAEQGRLVPVAGAMSEFPAETAYAVAAGQGGSKFGSGRHNQDTFAVTAFDTTQITHPENRCRPEPGDPCHPLAAGAHPPAIAFSVVPETGQGADLRIRRLVPEEAEALMSLPRGYTAIPGAKDSPRYRALGNSFVANVVRWIGRRILAVEEGSL